MEKLIKIARSIFERYAKENGYEAQLSDIKMFKVVQHDIDRDGKEETCFVAGIPDVWDTAVCCLIDWQNGSEQVIELVPVADGFRDLQVFDINNDGIPEIVSLWQAGSGAYLSLYIFQWDGNTLNSLFPTEVFYQGFMEIKDLDADGVDEILIWQGKWVEEFEETNELDIISSDISSDTDLSNCDDVNLDQLMEKIQEAEIPQWGLHRFDIHVFCYQENGYKLRKTHTSKRRYKPSSIVSRKISIVGTPPDAEHRFTSVEEYRKQFNTLTKNKKIDEDFVAGLCRHQSVLWQEGFYDEAISVADLGIEATKHLPNSQVKTRLQVLLWREKGVTCSLQGNYPQAVDCYCKAIFSWNEDVSTFFSSYYRSGLQRELGTMYSALGNYERALSSFSSARKIWESLDLSARENYEELSRLHSNLGLTYARLGELELAIAAFKEAIVIDKELANNFGLVINYMGLGNVQRTSKKYKDAISSYKIALTAIDEVSDRDRESDLYLELGSTLILRTYAKTLYIAYTNYSDRLKIYSDRLNHQQNHHNSYKDTLI